MPTELTRSLGVAGIVLMVVAAAAPITGVVANFPLILLESGVGSRQGGNNLIDLSVACREAHRSVSRRRWGRGRERDHRAVLPCGTAPSPATRSRRRGSKHVPI